MNNKLEAKVLSTIWQTNTSENSSRTHPFLSPVCANHTSYCTTTPHHRTHAHMHAHAYKIGKKYGIITTKNTIIALHGAETWDDSGSRSETYGKFRNVVLEKDG